MLVTVWSQFDNNDTAWQTLIGHGEQSEYRLGVQNNGDNANYAGGAGDANGGPSIQTGDWFHVVGTTDLATGDTEVFVNGVSVGTNSGGGIVDDPATNLWIGNNPEADGRQWDGRIDDVAQWNRVLTAEEVALIYNEGLAGVSLGQIPEPSSSLLLGLSGLMITLRRRR